MRTEITPLDKTQAYRVAKEGYPSKSPEIRARLGLPLLTESLCADLLTLLIGRNGQQKIGFVGQ